MEGDGGEIRKLIESEHTETRRKIVEDLKEYIKEMFQPVNKALGLTRSPISVSSRLKRRWSAVAASPGRLLIGTNGP